MRSTRSERETLCAVLDSLGVDGSGEFRSDASNEQLYQGIVSRVEWLKTNARDAGRKEARDDFPVIAKPSRLELPEPTTLEGALSSLRLWRASARRLHARLESVLARAKDAPGIVRVWAFHHGTETGVHAVADWVATGDDAGAAERMS